MADDTQSLASPAATTSRLWYLPAALLLVVFAPALWDLVVDWWDDPNYSHGFLVPVISGYLLWKKREALRALPLNTDRWGVAVIVVGLMMFVAANGAAEYFTLRLSFVVTLIGLIMYLRGRHMLRHTWFELAFLVFMIPLPYVLYYSITFPMQLLASKITVGALNVLGAGAVRQGNIIHLGGQALEVAEACSGMRSLVSLAALGALYAYLSRMPLAAKLLLFISTVPIAVAGNVVRVFVTSILSYAFSLNVTAEPLHSIMGLIVFAVAFVLFALVAGILGRIFR